LSTKRTKARTASKLEKADIAVAETLVPHRNDKLVKAVGGASEVTDQPPLYGLSGAVVVAGLITGNRRLVRAGARMLAAHVTAIGIKNLLKRSIDRTRPKLIAEGRYERGPGKRFESDYNSFPSGHTASAIAVARAMGRDYPEHQTLALAAASVTSAVQVVRSNHYLSDVAAGATIGLVAEAAVDRLFTQFVPLPAATDGQSDPDLVEAPVPPEAPALAPAALPVR
jgi:hypothetical protein